MPAIEVTPHDWPGPDFWEKVRKLTPVGKRLLAEKLRALLARHLLEEDLAWCVANRKGST
jgi:hypothetical protein